MKKHSKSKNKIQAVREYFIPMTKNQLQRKSFQLSVHDWVLKKFDFVKLFIQSQLKKEPDAEITFKKRCKQLQNWFQLKHKLEGLLSFIPLDFYETVIKYVMEKKLYWTFKMEDTSEPDSEILHKNTEIQLALELKKFYKHYEYNQNNLSHSVPHINSNRSENHENFSPNKTSVKGSFRRANPDFLYDLLMMFSVGVVAAFFQHFFPQLQIDKVFRSEIYIIINHGFLDIEVSPSVYDIMQKKHCTNNHTRNFQSLNANYLHEYSNSFHKSIDKNMSNLDSKRTIGEEKIKSTAIIANPNLSKTVKTDGNAKEVKHTNSSGLHTSSSNRFFASNGFETQNIKKPPTRNGLLIKPATSIGGGCLPSDRPNHKNAKSHPNMQASRFNSFIKDTKQMSIPTLLEEAIDNGYLPTNEEIDFYATVRNCLHVDALPPIKKKKMNIYQYEKLNEVDKIQEIKKQIKTIDQQGKKQHLMSNDISLAMNTFISTSSNFLKKKKIPRDMHLSTEHNQPPHEMSERKIGMKSMMNAQNKENYELKKLPLKASTLKFQLTKSCNFYTFDDKVLKINDNTQKEEGQSKASTQMPPPSFRKINETEKLQKADKFIERNKKCSTETVDTNQFAKSTQLMNETMSLRENNRRADRKRHIERRKYSRDRISDLHKLGQSFDLKNMVSFKHIESKKTIKDLKRKVEKNEIEQNEKPPVLERESIINNFELSNKMQKYELGTKQVTQVEVINENTNRSEDCLQCGVLEGEVNVQKDAMTNYKSMYKSFELKKKLRDFEVTCKKRQEIAHYSMFNIHVTRDPMSYGTRQIKEEDDEQSRPSLCNA